MDEGTWRRWLQLIRHLGEWDALEYTTVARTFRHGSGQHLSSKREVKLPAKVFGSDRGLVISTVPGAAPLRVSRANLEAWGVVLDFRNHKAMLIVSPNLGWTPMRQSGHGRLLVELIPKEAR